jgi:Bacterial Ig domain
VTLTDPVSQASVSGTVMLSASAMATSPAAVASVQFLLDGLSLGSPRTAAPYTLAWTVGSTTPGLHYLSARVTDTNGDMSTAPVVPVTVTVTTASGLVIDESVSQQGNGVVTTTPFSTHANAETLVAFVTTDGPAGAGTQSATVTGAGLSWKLIKQSNGQSGDAEVWSATAPSVLTNATVTSSPAAGGFDQMLTVLAFQGASGIGASAMNAAVTGAPAVSLTATAAGSLVYAAGTDWDSATARTPGVDQGIVSQWVDTASENTFWTQVGSNLTTSSGQTVVMNDTAPTTDRWDLAAIEVVPKAPAAGTSPAVSLINPTRGQTLSATVPLAANVTDNAGGASVQFYVDGAPLGRPVTSAPYAIKWNTTSVAPGAYVVSARATDDSGEGANAAGVPVTVANPAPPMTCFVMQADVSRHAVGTVTTPSFHTAAAGEVLVAFVSASGPPGARRQTATVSGAGLRWTLVRRQNAQTGDSEVWTATADHVLVGATVRSILSRPRYGQALTVIAMEGVSGIGASAGASASHGAPKVHMVTTGSTSLVFAVGNDQALRPDRRAVDPLGNGWVPLDQWQDIANGSSNWSQYTNDPTGPVGSPVLAAAGAPPHDSWNLAAVEFLNDDT